MGGFIEDETQRIEGRKRQQQVLQEQWKLQAALKRKEDELQRHIKRHDSFEGGTGSKSLEIS